MKLDIDRIKTLTLDESAIAREIVNSRGNVYSARPRNASGDAQYVWRNFMFYRSNDPRHQCLPVMAAHYLDVFGDDRRARIVELDRIVDKLIANTPPTDRSGASKWVELETGYRVFL